MKKVVMSEKGQITLPVSIRNRFNLSKGDKLIIEEGEKEILLRPVSKHPLLELQGKYKLSEQESLTNQLLRERKVEREQDK
ncbi:MAG: AbrB/MazE/SpoVT family DNA-binding domain-containing protein [Bacillota bacterium]